MSIKKTMRKVKQHGQCIHTPFSCACMRKVRQRTKQQISHQVHQTQQEKKKSWVGVGLQWKQEETASIASYLPSMAYLSYSKLAYILENIVPFFKSAPLQKSKIILLSKTFQFCNAVLPYILLLHVSAEHLEVLMDL